MNKTAFESPDKESHIGDENSYVPETPQSVASPQTCNGIPIPSLTRIRRSLGVLDNSPPDATPSLKQCCDKSFSDNKKTPRFKNCSEDDLHFLKKVKVSLFHDKHKEKESPPEEEKFSINAKAFYGSSSSKNKTKFRATAPVASKSMNCSPGVKRKSSNSSSMHASLKQSMKRHKAGEINCGIGHGIRKPKPNKQKSNNSMKAVKMKSLLKQKDAKKNLQGKGSQEVDDEVEKIEIYDPTKKFFKCKYITRSKAKKIDALEDIENNPNNTNEKLDIDDDDSCQEIAKSPDSKSKKNRNQSNLNKLFKRLSTSPLKELQKDLSHEENSLNISTTKFDVENITSESDIDKYNVVEKKTMENTSTHEKDVAYLLSVLQDNTTENEVPEEELAQENVDSIKDKQSKEQKAKKKSDEIPQFKVVNKSQYLTNTEEDHFNIVECFECKRLNFLYQFSNENNNDTHTKYHDSLEIFKFQEWENQHLCFEEYKTTVQVYVLESDDFILHKTKLEKVLKLITEGINVDYANLINKNDKVYVLIKHNLIISILVVGITIAQDNILCKPIVMFGVKFIWTVKKLRRQKMATRIIDVMRSIFSPYYTIAIDRIAFSKNTLTSDGKAFAASYTKSSDIKIY